MEIRLGKEIQMIVVAMAEDPITGEFVEVKLKVTDPRTIEILKQNLIPDISLESKDSNAKE